jgi:hypothetical protein
LKLRLFNKISNLIVQVPASEGQVFFIPIKTNKLAGMKKKKQKKTNKLATKKKQKKTIIKKKNV